MLKTLLVIFILIFLFTGNTFSQVVEEWVARYNGLGNSSDTPRTIAVDDSGNIYVSGESFGVGSNFDYAVVKYNSEGIQEWIATYNGPGNHEDRPFAMSIKKKVKRKYYSINKNIPFLLLGFWAHFQSWFASHLFRLRLNSKSVIFILLDL